jgi:outer membrane scaffolding protein for murein synthesis (MipA/OmpV family)
MIRHAIALSLALAVPFGPALAQDVFGAQPQPRPGNALSFTLRGGLSTQPEYPGADEYEFGPDLGFQFGSLEFGRFGIGDPNPGLVPTGLGVRGSFRYVGERDSSDFDAIDGLDDVDDAVELGLGLSFRQDAYQVFGDLRYGIIGHDSFVGEIGADVFVRPTDRLTINAGPRVFFGQEDYAEEYFGVSQAEAAASGLDAFDADGGALSAGLEVGARYRINDDWGIEGAVTYDRLIGDAEDSPITEAGSADQYGVRLGVTRRITFGF